MKSTSRVGALVILFAALVIGAFAFLNKGLFSVKTHTLWAKFDDAGGLNKGALVTVSGVNVGTVTEVALDASGQAMVKMAVRADVPVYRGTEAILPGSFIAIGDRMVQLKSPLGKKDLVEDNNISDPIRGHLQGPLEGVAPDAGQTVTELNKTLVSVRELLSDPKLKGDLHDVMANAATTADKFGGTADRVSGLIDNNQDKLTAILTSVKRSLTNLEAVSLRVKQVASDKQYEESAKKIMSDMDAAVISGKSLIKDLSAYTADPDLQSHIKSTVKNVDEVTSSGTKIAKDFESVSADSKLIAKNGVEASEKVNKLLDRANKLADEVSKALDDAKGALKKIAGNNPASLIPPISVETDLTRQANPDRLQVDINFGLPLAQDTLRFGLYDAFETNKINAQLAHNLRKGLDFRYGVYASKPGIGVDYAPDSKLGFRADLFGLNSAELDARFRYDLGGGVRAWFGMDRIFDRNTPSIGIGIKRG